MPLDFRVIPPDPELRKLGIHADMSDGPCQLDYLAVSEELKNLLRQGDEGGYLSLIRNICKQDFFAFCYFCLDMPINHPFLMARAFDVHRQGHMVIDLWFREGWKSSLNSYARPIWEVIINPEERIGIFSHTRTMAKSHLLKIKTACEKNIVLLSAWPDIFFKNPEKEAIKWSLDEGLYVKRQRTYGEATWESWGLIDSSPVGKHFSIMIFDDVITPVAVATADQIMKATTAYKMALNLGTRGGARRIIGTRYSARDTYSEILKQKKWTVRIHPAEVDETGKAKRGGQPVYLSRQELDDKFAEMGEWVYGSQMLQDPVAASEQKFMPYWLKFWQKNKPYLNYYITVDPASEKKKSSDYTVMCVIGTDAMRNFWLVDMVRDRLDLGERWEKLRGLCQSYQIDTVGYEKFGMQADLEYIKMKQEEEGVFFHIIELGGNVAKYDRIKRLVPLFQRGRFIIPRALVYTDVKGEIRDLTHDFLEEEYNAFPFGKHDDMLDAMSRITDAGMGVIFPTRVDAGPEILTENDPLDMREKATSGWMSE